MVSYEESSWLKTNSCHPSRAVCTLPVLSPLSSFLPPLIAIFSLSGFGFCSVVFGWDTHDSAYSPELKISNLSNGYRDLVAKIDLNSYRRTKSTPQLPSFPFFLVTFTDPETAEGLHACPRATLSKVVKKLEGEGLQAFAGAEVSTVSRYHLETKYVSDRSGKQLVLSV
jgi:hypothetical protein